MRRHMQLCGAFVPIFVLYVLSPAIAAATGDLDNPASLPKGLYPALIGAIQSEAPIEYAVTGPRDTVDGRVATTYRARNAVHAFDIHFGADGPAVATSQGHRIRLDISSYGYAKDPLLAPEARLTVDGNRVEYRRGGPVDGSAPVLTEWYVNGPLGLEQGFTLAAPPPGDTSGALVVTLAVAGDLTPALDEAGRDVRFLDAAGNVRLRYGGLFAYDAAGRPLPARLALDDDRLTIEVKAADAAYPLTIDPLISGPTKLTGAGSDFGLSVAVSGDTAVVGTHSNNSFVCGSACFVVPGKVYVFVRDASGWVLQQLLTNAAADALEHFGISVAIDNDTLAVGAPRAEAVYVYRRSDGIWSEPPDKLVAPSAPIGANVGASVAIDGNTVVAGAPNDGGKGSGAGYLFEYDGADWIPLPDKLLAPAPGGLGSSVAIDGDRIVIGAPYDDDHGTDAGAAYIFVRGDPTWPLPHSKITAGLAAAAGDWFGSAISISGDYVAVGAPGTSTIRGAVYVFEWTDPGTGFEWLLSDTLSPISLVAGDRFGSSVSVSGKTIVAGARFANGSAGEAYLFVRSGAAEAWEASDTNSELALAGTSPAAPAAGKGFGSAVAVDGEAILVGAPETVLVDGNVDAGSAFVYELPPTPKDFGGDGISDILWRGWPDWEASLCEPPDTWTWLTQIWNMGVFRARPGQSWRRCHYWQTAGVGDFDLDGQDDILWHNVRTGEIQIWQMDGDAKEAEHLVRFGPTGTAWQVKGIGDFGGGAGPDILWHNTATGNTVIWQMDGFSYVAPHTIGAPSVDWQIVGIGDFTANGQNDILWRRVSGAWASDVVLWQIIDFVKVRGDFVAQSSERCDNDGSHDGCLLGVPVIAPAWHAQGIGRFTDDAMVDILWRQTSNGNTVIWQMNGFRRVAAASIGAPPLIWQIEDVADYSGDGHADILWQKNGGTLPRTPVVIWQMNGFTREASAQIGVVAHDWHVQ